MLNPLHATGASLWLGTLLVVVVGLGAWNWRRVRPILGDEPAAYAIRRSAAAELGCAALVLVVTAVLINLPTPKLPAP